MSVADPQECRDFLAANPGVKYVEVFFTSMTGVPRGKRLRGVHRNPRPGGVGGARATGGWARG